MCFIRLTTEQALVNCLKPKRRIILTSTASADVQAVSGELGPFVVVVDEAGGEFDFAVFRKAGR